MSKHNVSTVTHTHKACTVNLGQVNRLQTQLTSTRSQLEETRAQLDRTRMQVDIVSLRCLVMQCCVQQLVEAQARTRANAEQAGSSRETNAAGAQKNEELVARLGEMNELVERQRKVSG